jgi:processive 1,2-diacylglycerol beta-glucosyltransferase
MERENLKDKHLLILSGPMGSGHIRAAGALEACAHEKYPELKVTTINIEKYMSFLYRKMFRDLYIVFANRYPLFWSIIYHQTNKPESFFTRWMAWWRQRIGRRMMKDIYKLDPEWIICTHFLPAEILNKCKQKGKVKADVSVIVTDFSLHNVYINHFLDNIFVNCNEVAFRLKSHGIDSSRIHNTGCPVYPAFARNYSEEDTQKLREEFGLPQEMPFILLMMGGENYGKIHDVSKTILKCYVEFGLIVLAGKNHRSMNALQKVKEEFPDRIFPVPFTQKVAQYMAVSDFIVTKPGGISTSEGIAMQKPLIIIYPIPGQEERNADYLLERSLAGKAYDEISLMYKRDLYNSKMLAYMRKQLKHFSKPNAGYDILEIVVEGKGKAKAEE